MIYTLRISNYYYKIDILLYIHVFNIIVIYKFNTKLEY